MIVKLLTEHYLELLSLKGGCRGSSESTLVKMSNCWKSHATAQMMDALLLCALTFVLQVVYFQQSCKYALNIDINIKFYRFPEIYRKWIFFKLFTCQCRQLIFANF